MREVVEGVGLGVAGCGCFGEDGVVSVEVGG